MENLIFLGVPILKHITVFRTIKPSGADQNDDIKNFAVVMSAVVKRVDCT